MALGFLLLIGIISRYLIAISSRAAERDLMSPLASSLPAVIEGWIHQTWFQNEYHSQDLDINASDWCKFLLLMPQILVSFHRPMLNQWYSLNLEEFDVFDGYDVDSQKFLRNWLQQVLWMPDCAVIQRYQTGENGQGLWNEAWICFFLLCIGRTGI